MTRSRHSRESGNPEGPMEARGVLMDRLAKTLDKDGRVQALRRGFSIAGCGHIDLSEAAPEDGRNAEVMRRYATNILRVVPQLKYHPARELAIDLVLFINGIPVATVEVKLDGECPVAYFREQVCQRDAWLRIFHSFVYVEKKDVVDLKGNWSKKETLIFPRCYQWAAVNAMIADARANEDETFVIDFINAPENVRRAFAMYDDGAQIEEAQDLNVVYDIQKLLDAQRPLRARGSGSVQAGPLQDSPRPHAGTGTPAQGAPAQRIVCSHGAADPALQPEVEDASGCHRHLGVRRRESL